jgi:hypothetical protein
MGNQCVNIGKLDEDKASEGFGEAPGTLWVWAPGLPKISPFPLAAAALRRSQREKKGFWRAYSPPNLPLEADRVTRVTESQITRH